MRAAAAAPVAAKGLAVSVAAQAQAVGLSMPPNGISEDCAAPPASRDMTLKLFKEIGGLPDWRKREIWDDCRRSSRRLDPDIACLQSVSIASKVRMQAHRNFDDHINGYESRLVLAELRDRFLKTHVLHWF